MNIEIRPYRPEDADEWVRVHALIMTISHAWNYCIQERPSYKRESTQLVAVANDSIIGLTDVEYDSTPGELCFNKESRGGYVLEFGRLPEYAGKGIGKRLINATAEDAKKKGIRRLEYWSQDRAAQRYYRRLGMPEIGRHYRFRFRAPQAVADILGVARIGVEYIYGCCTVEDWPTIKSDYDIVCDPPLEPRLCVGFELRF